MHQITKAKSNIRAVLAAFLWIKHFYVIGLNIKNRNRQCYFYVYFYVNCHKYPKHVMFMLAVNYLESRLLFRFQLPTLISNISQC